MGGEAMHWLWLPLAVGSSLVVANNVEINRRARQDSYRLNMWRMILAALFWLPLALRQPWPHNGLFYAAAMFSGVGMIIGFVIQNDLAKKHNGRVAILYMPLKAVLVFVVWAVVDPAARQLIIDKPLATLGVLGCLAVMVGSLGEFRKHDVSWESLKTVMPIVVIYGASDLLTRTAIDPAELHQRLIVFLSVGTATSALVSLMLWPWRPKPELPFVTKKLLKAGAYAATGSSVNQVCYASAVVLAPSPAYAGMIVLLSPVWLLVYHRMVNIHDDASPVAGTVMVAAAIILMVLVS